jgi:2-polyprenyl-3-methyl-5-hydroxy-6-metoxy-1,4-benzoquinol methylase
MQNIINYTCCPFCQSTTIAKTLDVKDYTVSHQSFEVWHCQSCSNRFTNNIPNKAKIGAFYNSENYISHSDTKEGMISKIYHFVRKKTLISKQKLVEKYCEKKVGTLLDVGAGTGAFVNTMQLANWTVIGLEPDAVARANAKSNYKIQLQHPKGLYNLPNNTFDAITLWHVMEHIHDVHGYFNQMKNLLTKNGKLFIAVPNYISYDATYYKQHWAGYDVPRHLHHFSPSGMQQLAKQHGYTFYAMKPMWFDSVYVSMLSQQYKTGSNNFVMALCIGLLSNLNALFNNKKCSSIIYVFGKR